MNEEQAIALKDVSVSPIVTAASDFNNAIYTADGRIASMGPQVVFHSGAMPVVLRHAMEAFPPEELEDGDMIVVNDPYYGAVHHPDVSLVAPIFHGGELLAWAGVAAHQVDMGGMSVGSISVNAREKQQEGLMMPPIKLIERGRLREDVWRLILNMTRQPQMVGLDLRGFIASNVVARDRLRELADRYGADTVRTAMEELIRYSERRLRERLRDAAGRRLPYARLPRPRRRREPRLPHRHPAREGRRRAPASTCATRRRRRRPTSTAPRARSSARSSAASARSSAPGSPGTTGS